jgi:hypothetical protein
MPYKEVAERSLRRYTELPALVHLLARKELTLLDPSSWDDKNDSFYLSLYRDKCALKSVLALCLTKGGETYHHWRVFTSGTSGVCIQFDTAALKAAVGKVKGVALEPVIYLTLQALRKKRLAKELLPFLKRKAFEHEDEVRLLWQSRSEEVRLLSIPIELSSIQRITISPWLNQNLASAIINLVKSIPGCEGLKIVRSTLISNDDWMNRGRLAT